MKTGPRLFVPVFSLLFVAQTLAQQTPTAAPTRDPVAVALLSKSLAAMTAGQSISDVTLQGTARRIAGSDDESGTAVFKALATGEVRMDFNFPSGPRSEVHSTLANGPAGVWSGPDAVKHPIAWHNLWPDSCWFFPAFTLAAVSNWQSYSLSLVGQETWNGQSVVRLAVSRIISTRSAKSFALIQRLSQIDIFLDSASLLPVAFSFNVHPDDDAGLDIPVDIRFSDYRLVNGAQFPFRVQKHLNNGLVLDLQFQTLALNTGLSPTSFSLQ